jgi:hypothetical protein
MINYNNAETCINMIKEGTDPFTKLDEKFLNVYRIIHKNVNGINKFTKSRAAAIGYIAAKLTGQKIKQPFKVKDRQVSKKDMALIFDATEKAVESSIKSINRKNLFYTSL